ncbi:MAG: hypothetical protein ACREOZ_01930, partial [Gloeomargaritales cyanobacterium]
MDGWPTDELRAENFSNGNGRAKIRCPAGRQIDELQAEDYAGEKVSAGRIGHRWPMDDQWEEDFTDGKVSADYRVQDQQLDNLRWVEDLTCDTFDEEENGDHDETTRKKESIFCRLAVVNSSMLIEVTDSFDSVSVCDNAVCDNAATNQLNIVSVDSTTKKETKKVKVDQLGWTISKKCPQAFGDRKLALLAAKTYERLHWEFVKSSNKFRTYFKCISHVECEKRVMLKLNELSNTWNLFENGHGHSANQVLGIPRKSDGKQLRGVWGESRAKVAKYADDPGVGPRGILARMNTEVSGMDNDAEKTVAFSQLPSFNKTTALYKRLRQEERKHETVTTGVDIHAYAYHNLCLNEDALALIEQSPGNKFKLLVVAQPMV